ncbi:MAG: hypothetical protein MUF50_02755 [Planctomycetes bacterium]|jgi:hypothetical protein|nr:hypothetical protein [Planctomycetota bacterium]
MKKIVITPKIISLIIALSISFFSCFGLGQSIRAADDLALRLRGKILLQVENKGAAWYVNPQDLKRYYLGRPDDAFQLMRRFGLGVSNADFGFYDSFHAPAKLAGRILLKVEDKGQAYYVDPTNLKLYYLGRPFDALQVIRQRGLGINNVNLEKIVVGTLGTTFNNQTSTNNTNQDQSKTVRFTWNYKGKEYYLVFGFNNNLYQAYTKSPKVYYYSQKDQVDNLQERYYGMILTQKEGDNTISIIANNLVNLGTNQGLTSDQLVEFVIAFVQGIPYDTTKSQQSSFAPNYAYETLYNDIGICSDKTFLTVLLLREMGYGAAILDYPQAKHSAAGIACPLADSISNSGYCYVETTNYFSIGIIPKSISNGQATSPDQLSSPFDTSNLGPVEVYQKTSGRSYNSVADRKATFNQIQQNKIWLTTENESLAKVKSDLDIQFQKVKASMDQMNAAKDKGDYATYNSLVPGYNDLVNKYNIAVTAYRARVENYNIKIQENNNLLTQLFN